MRNYLSVLPDAAVLVDFTNPIRLRNARAASRVRGSVAHVSRRVARSGFNVEPKTEEVIHCLTELVTAGSPEASKHLQLRTPEACLFR